MEAPKVPPDLSSLERMLAQRECPEPAADLKERVIQSVEAEISRIESPPQRANGWWGFVAATAASVVLLLMNQSLSAARATSYDLDLAAEPQSLDTAMRQIRELLPDLSRREAMAYAMTNQADSKLARCPDVAARDPARRLADLDDYFSIGE